MKAKTHIRFFPLAILLLITFSVFFVSCNSGEEEESEIIIDDTTPVEIYQVRRIPLARHLEYSGNLEAGSDVIVSAEVGGRITRLNLNEGDEVFIGSVVVKIDDTSARLNSIAANAQLTSAQSTLAIAEDPMREGQIAQMQSALDAAQAQFEVAETGLERAQRLYDEGAISQSELEGAEVGFEGAKAGRDSAQEVLNLAIEGSREEEIAAARGAVDAARASAALAADQLAKTGIKSPIDGIVTTIFPDVGELTGPGTPAFRVLNAESLTIKIGVGDREISGITELMGVDVIIDAFPDQIFEGVVTSVGIVSDPMTGTFPVEITIPNETGEVNAGMVARANVMIGEINDGIVVPVHSIITTDESSSVFVESAGVVELREVEVGLYVGDRASIVNGLMPGDRLVVSGQQYLKDGEAVSVQNERDMFVD